MDLGGLESLCIETLWAAPGVHAKYVWEGTSGLPLAAQICLCVSFKKHGSLCKGFAALGV